jgi:hypothetical protein
METPGARHTRPLAGQFLAQPFCSNEAFHASGLGAEAFPGLPGAPPTLYFVCDGLSRRDLDLGEDLTKPRTNRLTRAVIVLSRQ